MEEWFGNVTDGKMHLSEIGRIASDMWYEIPFHFPYVGLDEFVVMPNHIHGIIIINRSSGEPLAGALHATPLLSQDIAPVKNHTMSSISPKTGSLSVVIRSYKSAVTKHVHEFDTGFSWQSRFHDRIICTSGQLNRIRKYITDNPRNWGKNTYGDIQNS